jgi:hypothetical protein
MSQDFPLALAINGPVDDFYMAPGHVPAAESGSEFIHFSPGPALAEVREVMLWNGPEKQGASVFSGQSEAPTQAIE